MNAQTVAQLADRMRTNLTDQQRFTLYYSVSGPPEFTAQGLDVYRCAIAHITPAGFLNDLNGVPKAKRPRVFPDRRPRAPATSAREHGDPRSNWGHPRFPGATERSALRRS